MPPKKSKDEEGPRFCKLFRPRVTRNLLLQSEGVMKRIRYTRVQHGKLLNLEADELLLDNLDWGSRTRGGEGTGKAPCSVCRVPSNLLGRLGSREKLEMEIRGAQRDLRNAKQDYLKRLDRLVGSQHGIITKDVMKKTGWQNNMEPSDMQFVVGDGIKWSPLGKVCNWKCWVGNRLYGFNVYIVNTAAFDLLLGMKFYHFTASAMLIPWRQINMTHPWDQTIMC
ncbi:hypothetical protein TWF730_006371 [Orbilia blumenaviensis]|uniref:Uncharacterized protein n=1 Tax=Orbilia blumenaviensis TaxID=1796055 RepID=A0AAV9VGG3_9PEZI